MADQKQGCAIVEKKCSDNSAAIKTSGGKSREGESDIKGADRPKPCVANSKSNKVGEVRKKAKIKDAKGRKVESSESAKHVSIRFDLITMMLLHTNHDSRNDKRISYFLACLIFPLFSPVVTSASYDVEIPDAKAVSSYSHPSFHNSNQYCRICYNCCGCRCHHCYCSFHSKVVVLEESALSAVEAAADAVIGENNFDDHHHHNDMWCWH